MSTARPTQNYAAFYRECASYPELPKFRRLAAQWTKKLYDDVEELVKRERALDLQITALRVSQGLPPMTFLNCPRHIIKDEDLFKEWSEYEQLLRVYGMCCLSH